MKYLLSFLTLVLLLNCSANKTSIYAQVEYEAGACFGFCPIYKISINSDRTAIFEAKRFNFSRDTSSSDENEGTFKGTIDQVQYDKLLSILDSLNPKNLNDFYGNKNVSDLPTSYLTIKYKDASIKKIQDYGKRGTPELQNLYQFFDDLRTNQAWTKIE